MPRGLGSPLYGRTSYEKPHCGTASCVSGGTSSPASQACACYGLWYQRAPAIGPRLLTAAFNLPESRIAAELRGWSWFRRVYVRMYETDCNRRETLNRRVYDAATHINQRTTAFIKSRSVPHFVGHGLSSAHHKICCVYQTASQSAAAYPHASVGNLSCSHAPRDMSGHRHSSS
ncbi:hypothetical protein M011DRAFT_5272 [Sporormia fimetaria CBS 119925]|uniref:Uncharacterized protein n=1 Tax=Sporormia fimetaria CBS 119925 TaxID=1340428 RepID=A0A6A6VPQ0_9PLEO|nr:hypothetical protein M011DRAFT_5272 [Sporormia fimetaria CBS 119925]